MFLRFFLTLRKEGFPASLHEYLAFLEGLDRGLVNADLEELYFLARTIFVKNEVWLDRFDKIFGAYFKGEEFKFWEDGELAEPNVASFGAGFGINLVGLPMWFFWAQRTDFKTLDGGPDFQFYLGPLF